MGFYHVTLYGRATVHADTVVSAESPEEAVQKARRSAPNLNWGCAPVNVPSIDQVSTREIKGR